MFCRGERQRTPDTWSKSTVNLVPRAMTQTMTRTSRSVMASSTHLPSMLSNLSLPEQKPTDKSQQRQHRQPSPQRASNRDVRDTRAHNEWRVAERSTRQRRTSGQRAKCDETNYVTTRCKHPQEVQCHQCGLWGHNEKHHVCE